MREHWDKFENGIYDGPLFESLPDKVWNPVFSLATHMVRDWIAPNVDCNLKTSIK